MIEIVPARRTAANAVRSAAIRSTPNVSVALRASGSGSSAGRLHRGGLERRAVRLHADRLDHAVRAAAARSARRIAAGTSSTSSKSITSMPWRWAIASRSGTLSTAMTRSAPRWRAIRALIWPIGPRPVTSTVSPGVDVGELRRLPRRGEHVGEEQVALVGVAVRHLDRAEVRLRHAQVLGLAAGDLAVELGVAEQRGALVLLLHLGGLALGVEARGRTSSSARRRC